MIKEAQIAAEVQAYDSMPTFVGRSKGSIRETQVLYNNLKFIIVPMTNGFVKEQKGTNASGSFSWGAVRAINTDTGIGFWIPVSVFQGVPETDIIETREQRANNVVDPVTKRVKLVRCWGSVIDALDREGRVDIELGLSFLAKTKAEFICSEGDYFNTRYQTKFACRIEPTKQIKGINKK